MHKPNHLVALATAAQFIIEKMDYALVLPDHQPGYLVVSDSSEQELLSVHVGTAGRLCEKKFAHLATISNGHLINCRSTEDLIDGMTSSQIDLRRGGSVFASQLVIGYASRDGCDTPTGDEAVAIMIAIKAGLLSKSAVRKLYCNRHLKEHNPHLRQLINTITWTS